MPVDFSRFMVSGRGNRFEPLPETVIPRLKMPVVAEPAPAPPVEVAPPPPPIPQISPEVLAQIQQQFNLPDRFAPPPPPVAPPVQVPPPVMQPAPAPAPEPTNKNFTAEELVSEYNNSRGAQDFSLTATYDPATNTFVEDVSAFGFEGDAATKQYTPEEFMDRLGYE